MLLYTSMCIFTYGPKDSLLSLYVTCVDVFRDDHWGHDLTAQSLMFWLLQSFLSRDSFSARGYSAIALQGQRRPFLAVGCGGRSEERNALDIHTRRLTCPLSCRQCFSYLLPFTGALAGSRDSPSSPTAHDRPTVSL